MRLTRRIDDPRLFSGHVLFDMLRGLGVEIRGSVREGGSEVVERLVFHQSAPLSALVYELGKSSDNFYAEMILKSLGAQKALPGTSAAGAEVVVEWLREVGALEPGTIVRNGSGLFDANRVSAASLSRALVAAYRDPAIGPEFVAQLAIGGVDGTLRSRFRAHHKRRAIRAKTGTLAQVVALSGYVLRPGGNRRPPLPSSSAAFPASSGKRAIASTPWSKNSPRRVVIYLALLGLVAIDLVDVVLILAAIGERHRQKQDQEQHRAQEHQQVELLVPEQMHEEGDDQACLDGRDDHGQDQVPLRAEIDASAVDGDDGEGDQNAQHAPEQAHRQDVRKTVLLVVIVCRVAGHGVSHRRTRVSAGGFARLRRLGGRL